MGPWSRVRVAKCQMLVTSLFVLLLGLAMATTAVLTYFGPHFAVIGHASSERTPYEVLHLWGKRASGQGSHCRGGGFRSTGGWGGAFLCFALVFCALVQVAFWRFHNPTQVEDAVLDAYDQVYEQAVKSSSGMWRQELVAIQDMVSMVGEAPSLGRALRGPRVLPSAQDCLQGIRSFLRLHRNVVSALISLGLASTVPSPPPTPPPPACIPPGPSASSNGLTVPLPLRARGCQPQEPCFYRRCQEGPAPHHPSEADALRGRRGPSSHSGHPPLLQDTHPPAHRSNRDAPASARTGSLPGGDELFSSAWRWDGEGGDPTRQAASM
uniref:Tetraspanin-32 n=1 Tax=Balaenoptera musculus TaxID=9771 RepID=A0A8C0HWL8_BALMU